MSKTIRVKKAFTLIELIIVIILVTTISFLTFSNFNFKSEQKYKKVDLENIKEFMVKNFKFEDNLTLSCIEDENLQCYIFIDDNLTKEIKVDNLFNEIPKVYNYDKNLSDYEFSEIRLDDIDYKPFFELIINSDYKHKNIVLDTLEDKVYLYSSIESKARVFENTNEILDRFYDLEIEVKDAF